MTAKSKKVMAYTVSAAARELNVTVRSIYRWLDDETLEEIPVKGDARLVEPGSVLELKRKREVAT